MSFFRAVVPCISCFSLTFFQPFINEVNTIIKDHDNTYQYERTYKHVQKMSDHERKMFFAHDTFTRGNSHK